MMTPHKKEQTAKLIMIYVACSSMLLELSDEIKGTRFYDSAMKNRVGGLQKALTQKLNKHFRLFKDDADPMVEKGYHNSVRMVEVFLEIIRETHIDDLDRFQAFLECYQRGEVAQISDEAYEAIAQG